jgi:hypothetical protein
MKISQKTEKKTNEILAGYIAAGIGQKMNHTIGGAYHLQF